MRSGRLVLVFLILNCFLVLASLVTAVDPLDRLGDTIPTNPRWVGSGSPYGYGSGAYSNYQSPLGKYLPQRIYDLLHNPYFIYFAIVAGFWSVFYLATLWGLQQSGRVPDNIQKRLATVLSLCMTLPILYFTRGGVEQVLAQFMFGWVGYLTILTAGIFSYFCFYAIISGHLRSGS